jgi:hypothetical protein
MLTRRNGSEGIAPGNGPHIDDAALREATPLNGIWSAPANNTWQFHKSFAQQNRLAGGQNDSKIRTEGLAPAISGWPIIHTP